jgi:hypothetical protein
MVIYSDNTIINHYLFIMAVLHNLFIGNIVETLARHGSQAIGGELQRRKLLHRGTVPGDLPRKTRPSEGRRHGDVMVISWSFMKHSQDWRVYQTYFKLIPSNLSLT